MPLMNPEGCCLPEMTQGLLTAVRQAGVVFAREGVRGLTIVYAASLQPLAKILEAAGFLSKETAMVRKIHFREDGEIARTQ